MSVHIRACPMFSTISDQSELLFWPCMSHIPKRGLNEVLIIIFEQSLENGQQQLDVTLCLF